MTVKIFAKISEMNNGKSLVTSKGTQGKGGRVGRLYCVSADLTLQPSGVSTIMCLPRSSAQSKDDQGIHLPSWLKANNKMVKLHM